MAAISARTGLPTTSSFANVCGKPGEDAARELRQHAVGHARCAVLLMHDQRNAGEPRGEAARARGEAAKAHHRARLPLAQGLARGIHRAEQLERRGEQRRDALAAHATHRDGVDRDAVLRNQAGFHAAFAAEPEHGNVARTQRLRDGEAGEDVPARAAGEDHHRMQVGVGGGACGAHAVLPKAFSNTGSTRWRRRLVPRASAVTSGKGCVVAGIAAAGACASPRRRATWRCARSSSNDTRSNTPSAAQVSRTLEPPEEINGRVRPLVGSRPRFTPIETKLCSDIHRRDAEGAVAGEVAAHLHALQADPECAAGQARVQRDDREHADEAQLFGDDGEDEVGVRFGQVRQLLHRGTEADAEPFAAPHRH
jgi:hypothetical protein